MVPPGAGAYRFDDGAPGTQRVANRPIVCHVLESLREAGATELAIVGDPDALDEIGRSLDEDGHVGDLSYLPQPGAPSANGVLAAAAEFVGDASCILHSAAGVAGQPLSPFVERLETGAVDLMLVLHRSLDRRFGVAAATERLLGIAQLGGSKTRLGLADICLLGPGILRRTAALGPEPSGSELDFAALAERAAATGQRVEAGFVHAWRRYTGKPAGLLELNRIVLDQQIPGDESFEGDDNRIEGRVVIHPTAEVTSSVILGPSIIGPKARVTSSYVGPYTAIGAGARIEGSEVERSIVLDGARIMHISGRIEASTVGRRASIFRDFGLPRAVRLHVGADVEVALN